MNDASRVTPNGLYMKNGRKNFKLKIRMYHFIDEQCCRVKLWRETLRDKRAGSPGLEGTGFCLQRQAGVKQGDCGGTSLLPTPHSCMLTTLLLPSLSTP